MMYFTTHLNDYSPKNRACAELSDWIRDFKHVLFKDELSIDAFKEEVHSKVAEINARYPKVRPISVSINHGQIRASVCTSCGVPDEVFILSYEKVRSTYAFAEALPGNPAIEAQEGGLYNNKDISDNKFQALKGIVYDGDGKQKRKGGLL